MQSDLVSVIIPAFNAEDFILDCVDSVLKQSYRNLEVLIINDGSTDDTREILESINDSRVIIINQENKGCSQAKNIGLQYSKGNFIQYLDADDYLSCDKIEEQVKVLKLNQNCTAVCKTIIISNNHEINGLEIDTNILIKEGTGKEFLLRLWGLNGKQGMVQPNAYLTPRAIIDQIGPWDESISPSPDEDGEYFARVLLASERVIYTAGINYYRKMENAKSLSQVFSIQRAINLLNTVEIKFSHLLKVENTKRIRNLYRLHVSEVAYQFGNDFPQIIDLAKKKINKKLFLKEPLVFALVSFVFGFKYAFVLKRFIMNKF
jgi:glycosyltransferase involved in cell wall biosynthesis